MVETVNFGLTYTDGKMNRRHNIYIALCNAG